LAERATAFNDLESSCIDIQAKLYEEVYEKCSTEEEREKIRTKCSEVSDWLYDDYTEDTEIAVLKDKLKEVKELTSGLTARVREQHERPEAMAALKNMLNTSSVYHAKAAGSTGVVDGFFTQVELDALGKVLNETQAWIEASEKAIAEEPAHQMPTVTAGKIAEKGIALDREVKYLANKARIAKQRKVAEEAAAAAKAAKEKADKEKAEKAKKSKADGDKNATDDESPADSDTEASKDDKEGGDDVTSPETNSEEDTDGDTVAGESAEADLGEDLKDEL